MGGRAPEWVAAFVFSPETSAQFTKKKRVASAALQARCLAQIVRGIL
jgi:hypothetical protein